MAEKELSTKDCIQRLRVFTNTQAAVWQLMGVLQKADTLEESIKELEQKESNIKARMSKETQERAAVKEAIEADIKNLESARADMRERCANEISKMDRDLETKRRQYEESVEFYDNEVKDFKLKAIEQKREIESDLEKSKLELENVNGQIKILKDSFKESLELIGKLG